MDTVNRELIEFIQFYSSEDGRGDEAEEARSGEEEMEPEEEPEGKTRYTHVTLV